MELETLETIDDAADVECDERPEVEMSRVWGDSSQRVSEVCPQGLRESEAGPGEETEAAKEPVPCLICEGQGYLNAGNNIDNRCYSCLGKGWLNISPDDPLPEQPGPGRVPYLHVRYHHGRPLWD